MKNFSSLNLPLENLRAKIGGACHIGLHSNVQQSEEEKKFFFFPLLCVSLLFVLLAKKGSKCGKGSSASERGKKWKISKGTVVITVEERKRNCWLFWLCRQMINNKSCFVLKSFSLLESVKSNFEMIFYF